MRLNTNPENWKIVVAVILILLTDFYQAIMTLGRLPETWFEAITIILHALILTFMFISTGEKQDG